MCEQQSAASGKHRFWHLQVCSLLHKEGLILVSLEGLDLLSIVHLSYSLLHDVAEQHLAVKLLGSVRVIVQHLVGGLYLPAPQLCPLLCILLINLEHKACYDMGSSKYECTLRNKTDDRTQEAVHDLPVSANLLLSRFVACKE